MNDAVVQMLEELQDTRLSEVVVAPGGAHFDFCKTQIPHVGSTGVSGCYTVYATCYVLLSQNGRPVSKSPGLEGLQTTANEYILGQCVERVGLDPDGNSLRVLFANKVLLSVFPYENGTGSGAWTLFGDTPPDDPYFIVWKDKIEPGTGDRSKGKRKATGDGV
jgi:hypothetical protein